MDFWQHLADRPKRRILWMLFYMYILTTSAQAMDDHYKTPVVNIVFAGIAALTAYTLVGEVKWLWRIFDGITEGNRVANDDSWKKNLSPEGRRIFEGDDSDDQ